MDKYKFRKWIYKLIKLLQSDSLLTEGIDYNCSIPKCGLIPNAINGELSKTFTLSSGEEKIIAFKLQGTILNITNVEFNISSSAEASCVNQLEIDLLADGEVDYLNDKTNNLSCGGSYKFFGCFNDSRFII